jgi:hypothetical protein
MLVLLRLGSNTEPSLKRVPAVEAPIRVFDHQKEERENANEQETDYGRDHRPLWHRAFGYIYRAASRAD